MGLRRRMSRAEPDERELEVLVRDERYAYVLHSCPFADGQRLIGVAFSAEEGRLLSHGASVRVPMRCDRCLWEVAALFRREPREE